MRGLLSYKQPTTEVERTVLRIKADSNGDIYLPTGGYSLTGTRDCPYSWNISIDGGTEQTYSGTGSASGSFRAGYGLKPGTVHTVTIKPVTEEFGWCRALCYNGSTYANTLINIISDKSYKGYAESAENTGNYFKYYQYAGCVNLLDTDSESLPDTVHFIGNNYRAFEYSGCTSLKINATENIHKQVRKIGINFRANQYQGCTGLLTVRIRALNRATTGLGYRFSMLSGAGNSNTIMYIEGGIVEGGNWNLNDNRIKEIRVFKGLIADYQTKLSGITSSKIVKNPDWDTNNYEFIEFTIKADSNGDIKVPVAGYSTSGSQDCDYDWMISVDGADAVEYSGTGSDTAITVGTGTAGTGYRIVITPKTENYGWGRAFGFYNSGIEELLTEYTHDSFKGFSTAYNSTGDYYKYSAFRGCTLLGTNYERLPSCVASVGDYYLGYCYYGCTSLTTASWEVIHDYDLSTMGTDYRCYMFYNCTGLTAHLGLFPKPYNISSYPLRYREYMFGNAGNNLVIDMWGYEALDSGLTNSLGLTDSHLSMLDGISFEDKLNYQDNTNWSNISVSKFHVTSYPFTCGPTLDLAGGLQLEWSKQFLYQSGAVKYSDGQGYRDTVTVGSVGLGVSDDEEYVYLQGTYNRAGYWDCLIAWQKISDLGVVTLPGDLGYSSWWYIRTYSPRGSQHDAYREGMSLYTSGSYKTWFAGWDWGSYTYWGQGQVKQYNMNGNTPTFTNTYSWTPFYYPDSNNSLDRFLGADRLRYNVFANERGITVYRYKDGSATSLGSTIGSHVEFSDDGEMVYVLNGTTITQYRMTKLLNFSTKVSTGKTFTTPASCDGFTIKGGHLYCSVGTTIYKYSIPNT